MSSCGARRRARGGCAGRGGGRVMLVQVAQVAAASAAHPGSPRVARQLCCRATPSSCLAAAPSWLDAPTCCCSPAVHMLLPASAIAEHLISALDALLPPPGALPWPGHHTSLQPHHHTSPAPAPHLTGLPSSRRSWPACGRNARRCRSRWRGARQVGQRCCSWLPGWLAGSGVLLQVLLLPC